MSLFVGSGCDSIKKNYFAAFVCAMDDGEYGAGSDSEPELSRYYPAKENALSRAQQRERQNENGEPSPLIACIEECAIARSVARLLDDMLNTPVAWGMFRALLGAAAGMNEVTPGWLANCFVNRAEPPEDEVELDVLDFYINKSLLDMAADRGLD